MMVWQLNCEILTMPTRITVAVLLTLALAGLGTSVYAACHPPFTPPGYIITPDDDVQVFLMYSEHDRTETLVV